jgi:hypothetical protein
MAKSWAGHAARIGEKMNASSVVTGMSEGKKYHLEDLNVDEKILMKCI